jgi:hypothetical protein
MQEVVNKSNPATFDQWMTEGEVFSIVSCIEGRTHYILTAGMSPSSYTSTMAFDSVQELVDYHKETTKDKYFIFHNLWMSKVVVGDTNPGSYSMPSITKDKYMLRGEYVDDPVIIRNDKIDTILE